MFYDSLTKDGRFIKGSRKNNDGDHKRMTMCKCWHSEIFHGNRIGGCTTTRWMYSAI